MADKQLRVLIAEDDANDAELILRELRRSGFEPEWRRVATESEFSANLDPNIDIILSDYSMPQFSGLRALELVKERGLEVPFLLISATIGEETAVAAMRAGAADYVLKDRLGRLGQAVERAVQQRRLQEEGKRAEERLREQAEMLDRAHDAIIVRNFDDRLITFWNSGAERLYGWTANEAIGQPVDALILSNRQEIDSISTTLLSTGEFRGVLDEVTKDGRKLTVEVWSSLICNADGTPRSVMSINNDITEQKKLETQLLRAQRLESIGTLASGVAHDLNNILTPILMCSQVLRSELAEEDRQSAISLIEESAQRGASVVKQVLTFARGVEGERVLIKPSHLIEEIVDIARKTFPKSIEISGRYPDDLWSIQGDPTQLHQVLLNLSVNARDAMPNGGSLVVWAENFTVDEHFASMTPEARPGQFVALRVSDTGTGMPRALIDKIFDPFFTTKEVRRGTGLGLSTVLGIVKSHGGFISVYSEQGKGTTFKLFLPATVTHEELQLSKTSIVPIQGNGELILVVDDEPNILGITKMILKKHRYNVLSAHDAPEALAIFAQQMQSIRLVLTDVSMPYMDGGTLARALKKMKSDLPIIASTGQGDQAGRADFECLGVKNILTKPYNTQLLLKTVHDTLQEQE